MEEVIPWLRILICHGPGSADSNENQKFYADATVPGSNRFTGILLWLLFQRPPIVISIRSIKVKYLAVFILVQWTECVTDLEDKKKKSVSEMTDGVFWAKYNDSYQIQIPSSFIANTL